jgi:hypothetical protein
MSKRENSGYLTCSQEDFLLLCGGTGVWTQSSILARQMLSHLRNNPNHFCPGYFFFTFSIIFHLFTCACIVWVISPPTLPSILSLFPPQFQAGPVLPWLFLEIGSHFLLKLAWTVILLFCASCCNGDDRCMPPCPVVFHWDGVLKTFLPW